MDSNVSKISYTAAGQYPVKVLKKASEVVQDGVIIPWHIQLIPTNRCNGGCSWCSCAKVDRSMEMSLEKIVKILNYFHHLGTRCITITGGGEPTLHPYIDNILRVCERLGIEAGLVSNGIKWSQPGDYAAANTLTWSRISVTDTESGDYPIDRIINYARNLSTVDVGISFTVTKNVNVDLARNIARMSNEVKNITHIRFVQDIMAPDHEAMQNLVEHCHLMSDKCIFQFRDDAVAGDPACLISQLKPVINCDGYVYPCCGVQYARGNQQCMPAEFRMCHWSEFHTVDHFNGSICDKCYYESYNKLLDELTSPIEHENFL